MSSPCLPVPAGRTFASAGGAYYGTVGVPIKFDATLSYDADGNDITGYYWDWHLDNRFECISLPEFEHTWHSAFSGLVRVYIFDDQGHLAWDEASVTVTGPETMIQVTAGPNVDLCVTDMRLRETKPDKAQIPGSQCDVVEFMDSGVALSETVSFPLYNAGKYEIKLLGTNEGAFELNVRGLEDGVILYDQTMQGQISEGETIVGSFTAKCPKGILEMSCGDLKACPGMEVDPGKISLVVEPDGTYDIAFTIRETRGRMPLESVSLQCSDITGPGNLIRGSAVTFDQNKFDIEPGGEQEVHATIPVSIAVMGEVSGTITAKCSAGVSETVQVTLRTPGSPFYPHCNGILPVSGTVGNDVTFDASNSYDPDGFIEFYCWDWDGDGHIDEYTDQAVVTHTWDDVFDGSVRLVIMDNDGRAADTWVQVTVTEAQP